jgi:hypothetical protein
MSDHTEWRVERREEPGWFGRLVAPQGGARPSTVAVLVGLLGVAAFVASMVLDWVRLTLTGSFNGDQSGGQTFRQSLVEPMVLGQVYALAGIALITLVGAVISRPELALRARLATSGLAIGMLSIALTGTLTMERRMLQQFGIGMAFSAEGPGVTVALEPGVFCAYGAAILPAVAVWLASRPAARAARATPTLAVPAQAPVAPPVDPPAEDGAELLRLPPSGRAGSVGGLTVTASEPIDLSVSPDAWPR